MRAGARGADAHLVPSPGGSAAAAAARRLGGAGGRFARAPGLSWPPNGTATFGSATLALAGNSPFARRPMPTSDSKKRQENKLQNEENDLWAETAFSHYKGVRHLLEATGHGPRQGAA